MSLEEPLMNYRKTVQAETAEEKIQETIRRSKEVFYAVEQEHMLSYHEFLWAQLKLIQKRWWIFQFVLLFILRIMLLSAYEDNYIQRGMGVMASLFVILIIPEFWKNRSCRCMEIEESAYYSLRQIYAARMALFGIVDMLLLTTFCATVTVELHFELTKLLVQFLLPMIVTACICFGTLCSKYILNETVAIGLCIVWSGLWSIITLNEKIYGVITLPIWLALVTFALIFLCITIYRTLNSCNKYWEVAINEIGIE
ncbi:hypothetical protein [Anaeromicropila populeti]|uniref:ABC-2 family transporter protein n=1 Tax=Anaeromicropila populeti TaxID=37658 RepID=A0A1I6I7D0_9FIRM|nr:hypothetical protein [Anaeromicropila populeti]SFR62538.1 hypothetical protein SAMN05661086_00498 [Anaeromicropila populeti]